MKPQELTIGQKAKSLLMEHGWRQGPVTILNNRVCLVEAVVHGTQLPEHEVDALVAATRAALLGLGFADPEDGTAWNDAPGRTVEEVLERLERI